MPRLIDARWTPQVNMLLIECSCGERFEWRADRAFAECPSCEARIGLFPLKAGLTTSSSRG
jgi:hypothetical protein